MTQGSGSYFDGITGAEQPVTVTLDASHLVIALPDGAQARWDYPVIEPLPAPAGRLRLGRSDGSTVRLELRDPALADAVKQHLGFESPQHQAVERQRRRSVIAWSAAGVAAVLAIGIAGLPVVAELLAPLIPHTMEMRIGEQVHASEMAGYEGERPWECGEGGEQERAGKAVFEKLLRRIETEAKLPIPIRPYLNRSLVPNAGAMPGGIVHVNVGIVHFVESPDELAGVIGHELGHVVFRHSLKSYLHSMGLGYLVAMMVGDVFTGGAVIYAGTSNLSLHYSRAQETQADLYGIALIARLNADTHAVANFWERIHRQQLKEADALRLTRLDSTHPDSLARAAAIRATPKVANPQPLLTAEEWQVLRQACSRK